MKKAWYIAISALAVLLIILVPVLYFSSDPPMGDVTTTDMQEYLKLNSYTKRLLRESYCGLLPDKLPDGCSPQYFYNYRCNFDGIEYFTIYLKLSSMQGENFESESRRISEIPGAQEVDVGEEEFYCFSLPDLEDYFSEGKSRKGFRFEVVKIDRSNGSIQYLVSYQLDNQHIPSVLSEMLEDMPRRRAYT